MLYSSTHAERTKFYLKSMTELRHAIAWFIIMLMAGACSSTELDPFENEDRYFTIWGYLDAEAETQYIRIAPVRRSPEQIDSPDDAQATLDAKVYMIEVDTGREIQWQKSLQRTDDGSGGYVHVFESHFRPFQGSTYRLEVIRSDSVTARAEVTVPEFGLQEVVRGEAYADEEGKMVQEFFVPSMRRPSNMMVRYYGDIFGPNGWCEDAAFGVSYAVSDGVVADEGWRFTARLTDDVPAVVEEAERIGGLLCDITAEPIISLGFLGVYLQVPDANWVTPTDVRAISSLSDPFAYSNIENGFGYLGAVGAYLYTWEVTPEFGWAFGLPEPNPQ
ncbi:MAG: hypothetical protein RhofKO_28870 [Rhodothermales bacterium]